MLPEPPSLSATQVTTKARQTLVMVLCAGALLLAYSQRFIQDDAFISFRYAQNLVAGHGLVFNAGERVEGYSNFLWVLIMAIPFLTGIEPVWFSQIAGLLAFAGTLYFCHRLAQRLFGCFESVLLFLVILGGNFTFSAFATGGMETSLHTLLVIWGADLTARISEDREHSHRTAWLFGVVCAAALLVRADSAIFVGSYLVCLWFTGRGEAGRRSLVRAALPLACILGAYLAWKLYYYGTVIPNTFWVKAASDRSLALGAQYLALFSRAYWLFLALLPALLHPRTTFWKSALTRLFTSVIALWLLYLLFLGGDFMEFRLLHVVLPFLSLLVVMGVEKLRWRPTRYALAGALVATSLVHAARFEGTVDLESVPRLSGNVDGPAGWAEAGRVLGDLFHHEGCELRIALTPAGAIPFYSRLSTLDMLGLNDAWVARHGVRFSSRPGHQRLAPHRYLMEQQAHLVLGHPQIEPRRTTRRLEYGYADLARFFLIEMYPEKIGAEACVLEIPLNETYKLTALYLLNSPCLDSAIVRHGWTRFPIRRDASGATGAP